jgi:hypothetical protein
MLMYIEDSLQIAIDLENKLWRKHISENTVEITVMADEYLQSTIAMIKRGSDRKGNKVPHDRDAYLPILEQEAIKRGLIPAEDGWDV